MDKLGWRAKLSRLDMRRDCSAMTSADSCWLCDELRDWNAVLGALRLALVEEKQGKLCLISPLGRQSTILNERTACYGAAFFIAWLPRKHQCIEGLDFTEGQPRLSTVDIPDFIARSPTNLRHINFGGLGRGDDSYDWVELLDCLGSTEHLEELYLSNLAVNEGLASKINNLLLANASRLKSVGLFNTTAELSASDILFSGIPKFEVLKELTFDVNADSPALKEVARLLRCTDTLQKLCMTEHAVDYEYPSTENTGSGQELVAVVCNLLSINATPTEFCYQGNGHFFTGIMNALESNDVLRSLTISCCGFEPLYTGTVVGAEIRSMLVKNRGLRSLTFENFIIDYDCADSTSAGLRQNCTLESLDLSESQSSYTAVYRLCSGLTENGSCDLQIGAFAASRNERIELARLLIRNKLYGRVEMPWRGLDAPGLAVCLMESSPRTRDIRLDTTTMSEIMYSLLCWAVSKSDHVQSLTVHLCSPSWGHVSSLRALLAKNTSVSCVMLESHDGSSEYVMDAVMALRGNECVTELKITCTEMDAESGQQLADVFAGNESLSTVALSLKTPMSQASVDAICGGLVLNRFVTGFLIEGSLSAGCSVDGLEAAVQRNTTTLQRAVRFALGVNTGKVCAEAFELFQKKASLITGIMAASELTETEARQAVLSARKFIRSHYLVINGIVRSSVTCYAGKSTQIDSLNFDCWLAIVSYLKVSDVIEGN